MVEMTFKKVVRREDHDEDKPMYVEIPDLIVDALFLRDGDQIEWTYFVNCKNQKQVTLTRKYTGL
ncbi:MAG: hypothetical protein BZ137_02345 [Methanosphaera sp. rholeuAM130]|nr:hypothetical protein [Methanosphaera sp.]RAP54405.1 MAG: hypothetical protein BZ137_02345 [Methanosphaera sp. rholeuAM130]